MYFKPRKSKSGRRRAPRDRKIGEPVRLRETHCACGTPIPSDVSQFGVRSRGVGVCALCFVNADEWVRAAGAAGGHILDPDGLDDILAMLCRWLEEIPPTMLGRDGRILRLGVENTIGVATAALLYHEDGVPFPVDRAIRDNDIINYRKTIGAISNDGQEDLNSAQAPDQEGG